MALILNIETSTKICSVSLALDGNTIALKEELGVQYIHSEKLTFFIEELIQNSCYTLNDLSAICVSKGPGSYTGLRIGVSCAKGLCYALKIPLISLDSLTVLAHRFIQFNSVLENSYLYPMIDARRMEVFTLKFNSNLKTNNFIEAMILTEESFDNVKNKVYLFGDGANKLDGFIASENIIINKNIETSAQGMEQLSYTKFLSKEFEDVAYFEPFYLKEFIAIPSKKKLL